MSVMTSKKNKKRRDGEARRYIVDKSRLRELMEKKGIRSYSELTEKVGGKVLVIYQLLRGRSYPDLARKIERFLGAKEGEIFRRVKNADQ